MSLTKQKLIKARTKAASQILSLKIKREFKEKEKNIWIIVEGKDDPCFYINTIINAIPKDWNVTPLEAGNKKNVIATFHSLDWNKYSKKKILFFVDRDLSDFLDDIKIASENLYVTDGYSIENSLITEQVLLRTLKELLGLHNLTPKETNSITKLFLRAKKLFIKKMTTTMTIILFLQTNGIKINGLNNINIKDIFVFFQGICSAKKNKKQIYDYTLRSFNCDNVIKKSSFKEYEKIFISNSNYCNLIRGKYMLAFFVLFANSIRNDWDSLPFKETKAQSRSINLSLNNAFEHIAVRARITPSLQAFYKSTIIGELSN